MLNNSPDSVSILHDSTGSYIIDKNGRKTPITNTPIQKLPPRFNISCPRCSYSWQDLPSDNTGSIILNGGSNKNTMTFDPIQLNQLQQMKKNQMYNQSNPLYATNNVYPQQPSNSIQQIGGNYVNCNEPYPQVPYDQIQNYPVQQQLQQQQQQFQPQQQFQQFQQPNNQYNFNGINSSPNNPVFQLLAKMSQNNQNYPMQQQQQQQQYSPNYY